MKTTVHDTVILSTSSHAKTKFVFTRIPAENDDERSLYRLCLADIKAEHMKKTLLQTASDRTFAIAPNRPTLKVNPSQWCPEIDTRNLVSTFEYGGSCYRMYSLET